MRSFEAVMGAMKKKCPKKVFFTIFEVCQRRELEDDRVRYEHVPFRSRSEYAFFKPYTNSRKRWKHKNFYVFPASQKAVDAIGIFNEEGERTGNKFPLGLSRLS